MLRERFGEYLGRYKSGDVYPYSTNHDRTKVSLQSALAGLYPPENDQKLHPSIDWMPIPTYTIPKAFDNVFNLRNCNRWVRWVTLLMTEKNAW